MHSGDPSPLDPRLVDRTKLPFAAWLASRAGFDDEDDENAESDQVLNRKASGHRCRRLQGMASAHPSAIVICPVPFAVVVVALKTWCGFGPQSPSCVLRPRPQDLRPFREEENSAVDLARGLQEAAVDDGAVQVKALAASCSARDPRVGRPHRHAFAPVLLTRRRMGQCQPVRCSVAHPRITAHCR